MHSLKTIEEVRALRWREPGLNWGFVPTMGALHAGHIALVARARAENQRVAVSIFVNPIQFNTPGDLAAYPRQLDQDSEMLRDAGVDLVWMPDEAIMYPPGFQTYVSVEEVTRPLEGAARPGHFRGVTTVVAKLFNVMQPARAYFGRKDAQQLAVIRQMAQDLAFNLEVVPCDTVRESDGLAMSSRNQRLDGHQRAAAPVLYRALSAARVAWETGQRDADQLRSLMSGIIAAEPLARIDYVSVADPVTLAEIDGPVQVGLFSMAVYLGAVRLIDNVTVGE